MSRYTFILNPAAGKGAGRKLKNNILASIRSRTSDFELVETSGPGDAVLIARETSSDVVVAIGGDGTIHEAANGIVGSEKVLGVIPIGSGNDFIKNIGVSRNPEEALNSIFVNRTMLADIGSVSIKTIHKGSKTKEDLGLSYFVNGLGVGFDAMVAERTKQIAWVSGTLLYIVAVLQTLGRYESPEFITVVDGRKTKSRRLLIAIGNGVCAGGGFYLTPDARVDDGVLDVCSIDDIWILEILKLMPRVMRANHDALSCVHFEKGKTITITASNYFSAHADGEVIGSDIEALKVDVIPNGLRVIRG